jgi:hypothetical protein
LARGQRRLAAIVQPVVMIMNFVSSIRPDLTLHMKASEQKEALNPARFQVIKASNSHLCGALLPRSATDA